MDEQVKVRRPEKDRINIFIKSSRKGCFTGRSIDVDTAKELRDKLTEILKGDMT